jgi:enterochelin esterase family protein
VVKALVLAVALLSAASCVPPQAVPQDSGPSAEDAGLDSGTMQPGPVTDAGTDAGLSCSRQSVHTADLKLLDTVKTALLAAGTDSERESLVSAFVAEVKRQGGTPLSSRVDDRVGFIAVGAPAGGNYSVSGTFNGWKAGQDSLTRIGQSSLYALELTLPRSAAQSYKLVTGTTYFEDRLGQNLVWDGINRPIGGEFNQLVRPEAIDPGAGRLIAWRDVPATRLNDKRDVFVYLPARYEQSPCPTLPAIYFQDGVEALTRFPFSTRADLVYAAHPEDAAVLVFIALAPNTPDASRDAQYGFGPGSKVDDYLAFVKDQVVPLVEGSLRVCSGPNQRGIAGVSLGGLFAAYAGLHAPSTFGFVGSQSGSFWWERDGLTTFVKNNAQLPVRFYLDWGCPDDNCDEGRAFAAALRAKQYSVEVVEEPNGDHNWQWWEGRLPSLLHSFRAGQGACPVQ